MAQCASCTREMTERETKRFQSRDLCPECFGEAVGSRVVEAREEARAARAAAAEAPAQRVVLVGLEVPFSDACVAVFTWALATLVVGGCLALAGWMLFALVAGTGVWR